jgi:hypothetical protein
MLTIDPGWNTAVAVWKDRKLCDVYYFTAKKKESNKLKYMAHIFSDVIDKLAFGDYEKKAFIEGVQIYGDITSQTSARSGYLTELSYLIGAYNIILQKHGYDTKILLPRQWKAQLPKEAVRERVQLEGYILDNSHEYDAVGIGLAVLGKLDKRIRFL